MDKPNFKLKRIKEFEKEFLQQSSCSDRECEWTKDRCFHGTEDVMKDFICASMELAYEKAYQDASKRFRYRESELLKMEQDSFRRKVEGWKPKEDDCLASEWDGYKRGFYACKRKLKKL